MLPYLHLMPRVERDIDECLDFIARQPRGKPSDRESDICLGIGRVLLRPESNRVESWRPETGIELRRCKAAQFAIVYAYLRPTVSSTGGVVSIRAVRHSRVEDVFSGVKEPTATYTQP